MQPITLGMSPVPTGEQAIEMLKLQDSFERNLKINRFINDINFIKKMQSCKYAEIPELEFNNSYDINIDTYSIDYLINVNSLHYCNNLIYI